MMSRDDFTLISAAIICAMHGDSNHERAAKFAITRAKALADALDAENELPGQHIDAIRPPLSPLQEGIESGKRGEVSPMGDFTKHADEPDEG